jgi:hypothetical protein
MNDNHDKRSSARAAITRRDRARSRVRRLTAAAGISALAVLASSATPSAGVPTAGVTTTISVVVTDRAALGEVSELVRTQVAALERRGGRRDELGGLGDHHMG